MEDNKKKKDNYDMISLFSRFPDSEYLSEKLTIEERLARIVSVMGCFGAGVALIIKIIEGLSPIGIVVLTVTLVVPVVFFFIATKLGHNRLAIFGLLIGVTDFLMPANFFWGGGIESGAPVYFCLAVVLQFLLFKGVECVVMASTNIAVLTACIFYGARHPEAIQGLRGEYIYFFDNFQSFVICGLFVGVIFRFQLWVYNREQKRAEEASRIKGQFLANMSHEIRTPLNAIIGMIAVAEQADDPEKTAYSMRQIKSASEHLLGVVNDILDISKIEEGKLTLAPVQFDVKGVVSRIAAVFGARAREKGLSVSIEIADGVPACLVGDDQKLAQVIGNLIGNAIKFTPEGGSIRLACAVDAEDESTCSLRFDVQDSGIGITEEQKDRLFEAFQQAESDTTRKYGGTGLGLTISKRIVELMDGRIWVESVHGEGSTFTFVVKLQKATGECVTGAGSAESGAGSGSGSGQLGGEAEDAGAADNEFAGHRLLIVEDVEINREILLTLLEPTGIEMECAENGKQALEMVEADPGRYDIVFMDIQMPVMDGYEATRRIRALGDVRARALPIVAISANTFREDVEKSIEAGMNAHIGKPIDMNEAIRSIRNYLKPAPDYMI